MCGLNLTDKALSINHGGAEPLLFAVTLSSLGGYRTGDHRKHHQRKHHQRKQYRTARHPRVGGDPLSQFGMQLMGHSRFGLIALLPGPKSGYQDRYEDPQA